MLGWGLSSTRASIGPRFWASELRTFEDLELWQLVRLQGLKGAGFGYSPPDSSTIAKANIDKGDFKLDVPALLKNFSKTLTCHRMAVVEVHSQ